MSTFEYTAHEVEEKNFEPLPLGKYRGALSAYQTLNDSGAPLTSQAGNRMVKLVIEVYPLDGSKARDVFDWLVDTPGAAWKTKAFMEAVGQTYGGKLSLDAAKGVIVEVDLTIGDPYVSNGVTYRNNKINSYKAVKAAPGETAFAGGNVPDSGLPF